MLKVSKEFKEIYLISGATDLRKSVDGLAAIIQQEYEADHFEEAVFLFYNKSCNRLKALYWDVNGFVLTYKRLDGQGAKMKWPDAALTSLRKLSSEEYIG